MFDGSKTKKKQISVAKTILAAIGTIGVISAAVLAPNVIQALTIFDKKHTKYRRHYYINDAINRLKQRGCITFECKPSGKEYIRLTEKGKAELLKYRLGELQIPQRKKWDGLYHVVIFDIHEDARSTRNFIRGQLGLFGFVRLQHSVWVYPYECEELIKLLKAYCRIGKDVLYLTVANIENDHWLKEKFKL